jgi:hypothetical protein
VKKDQDDEAAWSALIYDYLSDQSRDTDERWGTALELLQLYEEPVGVIVMLAAGAAVPDWVRKELAAWCEGQRPPLPSCSDDDKKLLAAVEAYRTGRRKGEKKEQPTAGSSATSGGGNAFTLTPTASSSRPRPFRIVAPDRFRRSVMRRLFLGHPSGHQAAPGRKS